MAELLLSATSYVIQLWPSPLSYHMSTLRLSGQRRKPEWHLTLTSPTPTHLQLRTPESRSVYGGGHLRIEKYVEDGGICNR